MHFISKVLNPERFRITRLSDGKQALDYLLKAEELPDVVLIDYHLPLMNGLDVIKHTQAQGKKIAYIFLTVDHSIEIALDAMHAGALDFIPKVGEFYDRLPAMLEKVYDIHRQILDKQRAEAQLRASLKEKEALLREIHHRVKNNMQTIVSMLRVLGRDLDDERVSTAIKEGEQRILAMAAVHEMVYQSADFVNIDIRHYLSRLMQGLQRAYGVRPDRVAVTLEVGDVVLEVDQAIPCGLLVNELVSNSLQHAFPDERVGRLSVSLLPEGATLVLRVADDGVGLPEGYDFLTSETLGFTLLRGWVNQMLGTIEREPAATGTRFRITFQKLHYE